MFSVYRQREDAGGEHVLAEHGVGLDRYQRLVADLDVAVNGEAHLGLIARQCHRGDLADLDTGHRDVVARRDAAGIAEVGLVIAPLRVPRQAGVAEGDQHQADHHEDTEDAGP